ncbi:MAG: hypothetical protein ABJO29_07055 [Yoonia sp.]|uniref:hypothetical protein n=1 Tax=Yoonia sp. TaxID=2212373 RepID=UPI0032990200
MSESAPYNQIILINDLAALSTRVAMIALAEHTDKTDTNRLIALVSMAQSSVEGISEKSIGQFALSLRTDRWSAVLREATIALSHMPCGLINGRLPGDAEGREIDGKTVDRKEITVKEPLVEKPLQTAVLSILMIVGIVFAGRQVIAWMRMRARLKKRQSKRFATQIDSHLAIDKNVYEAEVLDLNCHGAKVRYWHTSTVAIDQDAGIFLAGAWRMGAIAWSNKLYCGVRFDAPLPIPLVRDLADVSETDGLGRIIPKKEKAAAA